MRQRLEEKNRMIEKKTQAAMQAQQERNRMNTELTEIKDHMDIKDRKINVLQRKVSFFLPSFFLALFELSRWSRIFDGLGLFSYRSRLPSSTFSSAFLHNTTILARTRPPYFYIHREILPLRASSRFITLGTGEHYARRLPARSGQFSRNEFPYRAHGSVWSYVYKERRKRKSGRVQRSVFSYHVGVN